MIYIFVIDIFDAEIIHTKCEMNRPGFVAPESVGVVTLVVTVFVESFLEILVSQNSCLWQAIHTFSAFCDDSAVFRCNVSEIVLLDDLIWEIV